MPRRTIKFKTCKRWNHAGDAHELTFTCYHRFPLLSKDRSRQWLADSIQRARRRHCFDLWAYVMMPEHVHLVIHPRGADYQISTILKAIKWPVARWALDYLRQADPGWLERLTDRQCGGKSTARFWQRGGGYDRNVRRYDTLAQMIEYIHANPVRRGLVAEPSDWRWSSARWYDGQRDVPLPMDDNLV